MKNLKHLGLDAPAAYSIRVEGCIGERWKDWFNDLTITLHDDEAHVTSTLYGTVADQAALLGLLQKLYGLGFPLLEVRCCSSQYARHIRSARRDQRSKPKRGTGGMVT